MTALLSASAASRRSRPFLGPATFHSRSRAHACADMASASKEGGGEVDDDDGDNKDEEEEDDNNKDDEHDP